MSCWVCDAPWAERCVMYVDVCRNGCMAIERTLDTITYSICGSTWTYSPMKDTLAMYRKRHEEMDAWVAFLRRHRLDPMVASFLFDRQPLVFADWCQEHGHEEVARIIRANAD